MKPEPEPKSARVTFRVPSALRTKIGKAAAEAKRSEGDWIVLALEQLVDERKAKPEPKSARDDHSALWPWSPLETYALPVRKGRKSDGSLRFGVITVGRLPGSTNWQAGAVEYPGDGKSVLDDHAHEQIGTSFSTKDLAFAASDRWLKRWAKDVKPAKKCPCKPIATAPRKRTRAA